ncbi:MAG: molybdopterin-dependent oxidoreductase [Burkholderiales bacterium]|nr:molybdopterin-dependent oxidoreductase [Burkholderiales bacterium]
MSQTRSTCPYCGVGCGVVIESDGGQITGVRGDPEHPANFGRLCTKGQSLHLTASAPITLHQRLRQPRLHGREIGWGAALDHAAERFAAVIAGHGPDAVGFYISGQLLTEDYYVFNKLAKGLIGTNNIDSNSRLCMSSAVAGYKLTLGADAPPACYADVDHADLLFIAGSNTAWAHPVLYRRIEDARRAHPQLRVIVVDPRRTETAAQADLHLALLPGTDVALFHGLLHLLLWEGLTDSAFIAAHTQGFGALRDRVREFTPRETARITGLREADLVQAARWFGQARAALSLYCQGLNQSSSGTAKNAALINLHLATGQIGRPGAGPFSLTGQPNAMGGREVGGMANLLSAHRDLANPAHRAEVARLWGVDSVPAAPGKTAVEMFQAAAEGEIKALWIACTNPAQSLPDQATVRRALERAEFVVLQEAFAGTATARHAHLLLPASSWGEKEGTVTNSERRISRVRAAVPAPGQARADWQIACDFARRLEPHLRPGRPSLFDYEGPEAIWNEHRESTRGRDLDITGLSWHQLDAGPACWPYPTGAGAGRERLYTDHRYATADGRARFADLPYRPTAEPRDARHPYALNTGRLRDQWHGMSRTGTLGRLFGHAPEPGVDLHPQEMARLRLAEGDLVTLHSRRGTLVLPARGTATVAPAQAFIAMHWGDEFVTGGVNVLASAALCPLSRQPELKHAAVRIERAELPWRLVALAWCDEARALQLRQALRPLFDAFPFAACVPFGRERSGVLFRAAAAAPADAARVAQVAALFGLEGSAGAGMQTLHYLDPRRGQRRSVRLAGTGAEQRLDAFLLAGDTRAEAWIAPLLQRQAPAQAYGRALLAPGPEAPGPAPTRDAQVCSCFDVGQSRIVQVLAGLPGPAEQRLAAMQAVLHCGTQCGSCLPELQRLAAADRAAA